MFQTTYVRMYIYTDYLRNWKARSTAISGFSAGTQNDHHIIKRQEGGRKTHYAMYKQIQIPAGKLK